MSFKYRVKVGDLEQRVLNGMVLHNGIPHTVIAFGEKGYTLRSLQDDRREVTVKDLVIEDVHLGNVQLGRTYGYVARIPFRQWMQTLTPRNCKVLTMPFNTRRMEHARDLYQVDYPTIDSALRKVAEDKLEACCFHKEWGFFKKGGNVFLAYRDKEVSVVS